MTSSRHCAENCVGTDAGIENVVFGGNNFSTTDGFVCHCAWIREAWDLQIEEVTISIDVAGLELMIVGKATVCVVHYVIARVQSIGKTRLKEIENLFVLKAASSWNIVCASIKHRLSAGLHSGSACRLRRCRYLSCFGGYRTSSCGGCVDGSRGGGSCRAFC